MLNSRHENLLSSIINQYIVTAEPVSSKFLEKSGFLGLKSATIRAEMNGLEELGFLAHIHTSGGRIPTDKAYRYFVDNLIEPDDWQLTTDEKRKVKSAIHQGGNDTRLVAKTIAQVLSELTSNVVITGVSENNDFFKTGLASLFELPDFREFDRLFRLASFFDGFEEIFNRVEMEFFGTEAEDLRIFIGRENPVKDICEETVILTKYELPDGFTGTLTLVGPTRMDYGKNIGLVRYAAGELNKIAKNI